MKKKVFSLLLCLVMCVSVLSGCNLFGRDDEAFFNAVVAEINYQYSIGTDERSYTETITKRDLWNAYYSYGHNYVESAGSQEEAVELTLDGLINRRLMITEVERYYKAAGEEVLNDAEKTYLWEETYEAIYDKFRGYYNTLLGIEDEEATDESTTSGIVYEEYRNPATLYTKEDGTLGIKKTDIVQNVRDRNYVLKNDAGVAYDVVYQDDQGNYIFKDLIYENILSYTRTDNSDKTTASNFRSALNEYMNVVRENYSYLDLDDEETCFMFELDGIYDIVKDNYMVEKYEHIYNRMATSGSTVTNVNVADVVRYYENNAITDYETYANDSESFQTAILSQSTMPNYINTSDATYFNVAVIKIEYDSTKKAEIDSEYEQGGDIEKYHDQLLALYDNASVAVKDSSTGEELPNTTASASTVLSKIKTALQATGNYITAEQVNNDPDMLNDALESSGFDFSQYTDETEREMMEKYAVQLYVEEYNSDVERKKASAIREYFYYYNDDTTYLNADKLSVFGISNSGEVLYSDTYAEANYAEEGFEDFEMYNEFQEAIKSFYKNGTPKVGDLATVNGSSLIRGSDGVYILFYAGEVNNLFSGVNEDFSLTQMDVQKLANTYLNVFTEKTIFDQIYDTLYVDSAYGSYEESTIGRLINSLTKGADSGVVKHYDNYKDMF